MVNIKKSVLKVLFISIVLIFFLQGNRVLAANLSVNIDFDGKKIEMTSETPEMEWNIEKLFPGETAETNIVLNSIGSKEVKTEFQLETTNKEIEEYLTVKVMNNKTGEMAYDGKYTEFKNVTAKISSKETNVFKVTIGLPTEIESSIKSENLKIKFKLVAKGEKSNQIATATTENEQTNTNEISTDIIKPIKKQKSFGIYIVFAIMICVLLILGVAYFKTK
jgi:hypothetical protein